MSNIIKPSESTGISLTKGKLRSSTSPFQQRVNAAKQEQADPLTLPNRICLMLDGSSSMSTIEKGDKRRIDLLKDALQNFVGRCNFADTSIALESFPERLSSPLSSNQSLLITASFGIEASGITPMRRCVEACLEKVPMTRGVIVSDGEATDWYGRSYEDDDAYESSKKSDDPLLTKYKEAGIPIDTVHIADSSSGEELLRRIARETGGIFIKFTDVGAFAKAFGFLAPSYRAMLMNGSVTASQIGAREVKS